MAASIICRCCKAVGEAKLDDNWIKEALPFPFSQGTNISAKFGRPKNLTLSLFAKQRLNVRFQAKGNGFRQRFCAALSADRWSFDGRRQVFPVQGLRNLNRERFHPVRLDKPWSRVRTAGCDVLHASMLKQDSTASRGLDTVTLPIRNT
ncbi:hypothetical protein PoB_003505000 [Plakobranchus ocellatus]|uniref:Uncharacterized protein n=1 Tax=Plakobranchus ocellatus TaxID=259542 RepID=A0AAV4AK44_9GAST|nr:hypothetical protein PoB_003505000 [Plakobranchus ocellatus]